MSIFGDLPGEGPAILEQLDAPFQEYIGAVGSDMWRSNPTQALAASARKRHASPDENLPFQSPEDIFYGNEIYRRRSAGELTPRLNQDEAQKRVRSAGLKLTIPEDGITEEGLNILMERKRDELAIKSSIARHKGGLASGAAGLGVGLAVSVLDPINVASAFIPVVGPGRYAAMLSGAGSAAGRAGVRVGVGAAEGFVGSLAVEPLVLAASRDLQDDYGLHDSLINIAFGTVLGGGLHAGAGYFGDRIAQRWGENSLPSFIENLPPDDRESILRVALAQSVSGRNVDIDPILRAANDARVEAEIERLGLFRRASVDTVTQVRNLTQEVVQEIDRSGVSVFDFLAREGGLRDNPDLRAIFDVNPSIPGAGRLIRTGGGGLDMDTALRRLVEAGYLDEPGLHDALPLRLDHKNVLDLLEKESRGVKQYPMGREKAKAAEPDRYKDTIDEIVKAFDDEMIDVRGTEGRVLVRAAEMVEEGVHPFDALERAAIEFQDEPSLGGIHTERFDIPGFDADDLIGRAQAAFEGPSRMADVAAARAGDERLAEVRQADRNYERQLAGIRFNTGRFSAQLAPLGRYGAQQISAPQAISAPKIKRDLGVDMPGTLIESQNSIVAYHGSPADHDKFSLEYIGTGEGAQAYGHGLYFAENKDIGQIYRKNLSGPDAWLIDGKPGDGTPLSFAAVTVQRYGGSVEGAIADIKYNLARKEGTVSDSVRERDKKVLEILESGKSLPKVTRVEAGFIYEVRIKADPEKFLDWDKPLSEQPKNVQELIADMRAIAKMPDGDRTGKELIGDIAGYAWDAAGRPASGPDKVFIAKASDELRAAGVPGIKYLDAGSRKAGDGSRNYVVFDDNLIEIVAKNGERVKKPESLIKTLSGEARGSLGQQMSARADISQTDAGRVVSPESANFEYVPPSLVAEVNEQVAETMELARRLGYAENIERELAAFDGASETVHGYGDAVRAMASCHIRRGG